MLGLGYIFIKESEKDSRDVVRDEERGDRMPGSANHSSLGLLRCLSHTPSDVPLCPSGGSLRFAQKSVLVFQQQDKAPG